MAVLVPNLFNVPFCDFGIGAIDGGLRSLTTYVVSRYNINSSGISID